jgi:NADPH:quinone reductase-like Zn-dependent oxidoreductase
MPELAARFNITLPSGFGYDFAGRVDEVGDGVSGFKVGDRVYGGVMERAAADFVVIEPAASERIFHTPEGLSDEVASTLPVAAATAAAVLAALNLSSADTVLVGGAAGGVGVFVVQLAQLVGATVIETASEGTFAFLRDLGVQPVTYGLGLEERVKACAPGGITAAIDLFGTETIETALPLGVTPDRIAAIAAGPNAPGGIRAVSGSDAQAGAPDCRGNRRRAADRADRGKIPARADQPGRGAPSRPSRPRQDRRDALASAASKQRGPAGAHEPPGQTPAI